MGIGLSSQVDYSLAESHLLGCMVGALLHDSLRILSILKTKAFFNT